MHGDGTSRAVSVILSRLDDMTVEVREESCGTGVASVANSDVITDGDEVEDAAITDRTVVSGQGTADVSDAGTDGYYAIVTRLSSSPSRSECESSR